MAGPDAGTLLGDMGADVVKIEPPGEGDYTRGLGPFPPGSKDGASFLRLNRNERSLALDLKRPEGKRAFLALVRRADVVIENFRAGTMDSLGVGYEALVTERPAVVYLSVTGFGRTGPYRDRPGLDLILQAESGIMSATGEEDRPPVKVGVPVVDMATALYGAYAVVCALRVRDRDGVGQLIDLSLLEAGLPCRRIHPYADVLADPHLAARGIFADNPHPVLGALRSIGSPLHLSKTPPRLLRSGPRLGEHSREILVEAGISARDIDALFAAGVTS